MAFTYDPTTSAGMVRLLIGDKTSTSPIFTDVEITALLARNGGAVSLAAADALDIIASNQAYVLKVMTMLDVTTNGAAVAAALRAHATELRRQDREQEPYVDIAEISHTPQVALDIWFRDIVNTGGY